MNDKRTTTINFGADMERLRSAAAQIGREQSAIVQTATRLILDHIESGGTLEDYEVPSPVVRRLDSLETAVRESGYVDKAAIQHALEKSLTLIEDALKRLDARG